MANLGQIADGDGRLRPDITHYLATPELTVYLRGSTISYVFHVRNRAGLRGFAGHRIDMDLEGANPESFAHAYDTSSDYSNFYRAPHCTNGVTQVHSFGQVVVENVYDNIDMRLTADGEAFKCDFIVRPGGDYRRIRMRYQGADDVAVHDSALEARCPIGVIRESAPVSYVASGSARITVFSAFMRFGDSFGFQVGEFDHRDTLTIDPTQRWSTYYGGSEAEAIDGANPMTVDRNGNVVVTGYALSAFPVLFPVSTGAFQTTGDDDAFVVKMDATGRRLWATLYGATQGTERPFGIATDASSNVCFVGDTYSSTFPITTGAHQTTMGGDHDGFIVKLDSTGARLWASFLGGLHEDALFGVAIDSSGNIAVSGATMSAGLGTTGAVQATKPTSTGYEEAYLDGFVTRFTSAGVRTWATYLGGSTADQCYGAAFDSDGAVLVSGVTRSSNFPTANAFQSTFGGNSDVFLTKLGSGGALHWSTYFGSTGTESDRLSTLYAAYGAIAVDPFRNVVLTGFTTGALSTTTGALQTSYQGGARDGFVAKFDSGGARLWTTYLGGNSDDVGTSIATNQAGEIAVGGFTTSTNFPTAGSVLQSAGAGMRDGFLVRLSASGAQEWGTYYGGTRDDHIHGVFIDTYRSIIATGQSASRDFPVSTNAYQSSNATPTTTNPANADAVLLYICDPRPPTIQADDSLRFCVGETVTLTASAGFASYRWSTGATTRSISIASSGVHTVDATTASGCTVRSLPVTTTLFARTRPRILPAGDQVMCQGDSIVLDAGAGYRSYEWSSGATTRSLIVRATGTYRVITVDANGCRDTSEFVAVRVNPRPAPVSVTPAGPVVACANEPIVLSARDPLAGESIRWSSGQTTPSITPTRSGRYRVVISNAFGCAVSSNDVDVTIHDAPEARIRPLTPTTICPGDSVLLLADGVYSSVRWSTGESTNYIYARSSGRISLVVLDSNGCRDTAEITVTMRERPGVRIVARGNVRFCAGDSVVLSVEGAFARTEWSTFERSPSIVVRTAGTYRVVVTDFSGCSATSEPVEVEVIPAPSSELSGPTGACINSIARYQVPEQAGTRITWEILSANGTLESGQGAAEAGVRWGGAGAARIRVTVLDVATGCSSSSTLDVVVSNQLVPRVRVVGPLSLCPGRRTRLDAGSGYAHYRWSTGDTTAQIDVDRAGVYSVFVRDAAGCEGSSESITVSQAAAPTPRIDVLGPQVLCAGDSTALETGEYPDILWSNGARTRRIVVRQGGVYSVRVVDSSGCEATTGAVTITDFTSSPPRIEGPLSTCRQSRATYCCVDSVGLEAFDWSVTGGSIVSGAGSSCITVQWGAGSTGIVSLRAQTRERACPVQSTGLPVSLGQVLTPSITASREEMCPGDTVTLDAGAGYDSYQWSDGSATRAIRVVAPGTYRVVVQTQAGCVGSDSVRLFDRPSLTPRIIVSGPLSFCDGDSVMLTSDSPYARVIWSTGDTSRVITVRASGSYHFEAFDLRGCDAVTQPVIVRVNPRPVAPVISVSGNELASTRAAAYQWFRDGTAIVGANDSRLIDSVAGSYVVEITDSNGCRARSAPYLMSAATATIAIASLTARPGDRVAIPITMLSSRYLVSAGADEYEAVIRFNKSLLWPTGATPRGVIDGSERVIRISGTRMSSADAQTIGVLDMIVALGDTTATALTFDSFQWLDANVQVATLPGQLTVVPTGGWQGFRDQGRMRLDPPVPNPATSAAVVSYEILVGGRIEMVVFDAIGQRVATLVDTDSHPAIATSITLETAGLAPGVYRIVLRTQTGQMTQSLHVVR